MSSYATPTDLTTYALQSYAVANISPTVIQGELDAASTLADSYLRGRYALPLQAWGIDLTMNVCFLAAANILRSRGANPSAGADVEVFERAKEAVEWFRGIQKQSVHPDVTPASQPSISNNYQLPQVISAQPRGWQTTNGNGTPTVG